MVDTKIGQGAAHAKATCEHELLSESLMKKRMTPYHTTLRARSIELFEGWVRHDGEEFLYVLKGIVIFTLNFMNLLSYAEVTVHIMMPLRDIT